MYFYEGLVGILRPLHSPSYLGSQDGCLSYRLFVYRLFGISAFWHIGFFGISAFWHIGFLAYWLFCILAYHISGFCSIGLLHIGFLRRFTRSAFCHIGFLFLLARLFVISAFCISAFLHIGFLHIGFLLMISSFLSYRLFVISAFCFIGFLISAF
jgi:hypothetical protein